MGLPADLDYGLYFDLSLYAILALGLFFGFLKGFKKSLFSFLTTLIFYVVFFLTIDMAVNFLWTVQIPQLGGWVSGFMPSLSGITSLSQALPILLEDFLRPTMGDLVSNVQFIALAEGLAFFVVKLVYTLLYFTIIFIVYKLICGILRAIIMPHRKLDDKYASKNRGFGAVFGLLEGAISVFVTLIMLGGLMSVTESLVSFIPESEEPPLEEVFSSPRDGIYEASTSVIPTADSVGGFTIPAELEAATTMMKDFVNAYNANPIVTYSSMVTMTDQNEEEIALNLYLFDTVLSFDYQANARDEASPVVQVSIRKELSVFAEIAGLVIDSGVTGVADLSTVTPEQITGLFDKLADSDLVTSVLPLGIEYAAQASGMENLDLPVADLYAVDWKAEIQNLGLIAASLYQIASDVGAFSGEEFNYETVTLEGEDIRSFFTSLSESDLLTLGALVAIEPLLEMAGDQVQLIITPPEGLEWKDLDFSVEFLALGNILAEVVDTNLTIETITSGDYIVILEAIQTMDLDVILSSRIIKTALINVLSGAAGIEQLSFIVVPDDPDFDWETELPNIIAALETILTLSDELGTILEGEADTTSMLELIGALTEEQINTIFESDLLVASLSEIVTGDMLGDLPLVIPDQILDENGYILKTEFVALVTSAQTLSANLMCTVDDPDTPDIDETDVECQQDMGIDINKAFSLSDEAIDDLLGSAIISATVGNLLYGFGDGTEGDVLTVPDSALDPDITEDGVAVSCVSADEIKLIFDAIQVLGIDDIENLDFDASIINDLSTEDDPLTLEVNEDDTVALFSSVVIRATITDLLNDMDLNGTTLVVPDSAKDLEGFLTTDELSDVVKAMKLVITINDCELPEAPVDCQPIEFDVATVLGLSEDDVDILLGSEVLNATIGKYMVDLGTGEDAVLTIPPSALENIQVGVDTVSVVSDAEIRAIFKAVNALGITDFQNIDFDVSIVNDLTTLDDPLTLDVNEDDTVALFGSIIIRATITDLLNDMDLNGTTLVVPDAAKDLEGYLTEEELGDVVRAMQLVIIVNDCELPEAPVDCQPVEFDVATVLGLSDDDVDILLGSEVLNATIGKYMVDLGTGEDAVLTIPPSALENVQVGVDTVSVVTDTEIRAIFKAVNALGITDFQNIDFDVSIVNDLTTVDDPLTPEVNEDDTVALFGSIIIRATITDLINDMDLNGTTLVVPDSAKDLEGYLTEEELGDVVRAMQLVIIVNDCEIPEAPVDCQPVEFDVATVLSLSDDSVDTLLESEVLNTTIGKYMVDLGEGEDAVLTIPDSSLQTVPVGPDNLDVVKESEIRAVFKAVNVLGLDDFTGVSFDASIVSDLSTVDDPLTPEVNEDDTAALFASLIIRATITDVLTEQDLGGTLLVVPDTAKDLEGYLTETELRNVVKSMKLVIVTDPITHETTFQVDTVLSLDDTPGSSEIDTLLSSQVIAATIGKYLAEMSDVLTVPESVTQDLVCGVDTHTVVVSAEIKLLFKAVNALEMESIENVDFDASILDRLSQADDPLTVDIDESETLDETKLEDLFGSAVLRATVSEIMTGENLGGTVLVVPKTILDAESYMTKTELKAMMRSLKLVITTDPVTEEITFQVDSVLALEDSKINTLLSSEVIAATIGQYLIDMGDPLVIPSTVNENITLKDDSVIAVVGDAEIRDLLQGVAVLEFTTFDGFAFDATIIRRLAYVDDPDTIPDESVNIDPNELTTLFESVIIQATMSDMMIDLTTVESGEPFVIIPDYELDEVNLTQGNPVIVAIGGIDCISVQELKDVLTAIFYLNIGDLNTLNDEIQLADIIANITHITASSILQATLSEQLLDTAVSTGAFFIPKYDENGDQIYFGPAVCGEDYITTAELNAMFYALEALGFTDLDTFTGVVSLGVLTVDKVNKLTASSIIQAKISEQVNSLETAGTIVVPTVGLAAEVVRLTVDLGGADEVRYISKEELSDLLWAMDALGIVNELSSFGADLSLNDITDNLSTLLASVIIHATISGQILNLDVTGVIVVPDTYSDGSGNIRISAGGEEFIIAQEIEDFMDSLELIGFGGDQDITGYGGAISLNGLVEDDDPLVTQAQATVNQGILLTSAIMSATISDTLIGLPDDALIVPEKDESNVDIKVLHSGVTFIVNTEVMHLIDALGKMGLLDVDTITSISSSAFFANRATILLSASMQATISDKMLNDTLEQLVVPDDYRIIQTDVTIIQLTEINAIMDVLDALNLENFGAMNFNPATIFAIDPSVLLASGSMKATISKNLLTSASNETVGSGFSGLIVPRAVRESITVGGVATTTIESDELFDLVTSLKMLGISDFDDSFSAVTIMAMSEADLNTFLNSGSIHNTIDKMLKGNTNISGSIPTLALHTMYAASGYPIAGVVTKTELVAFIRAVQKLGGSFTTVSLDISTILGMDEADRDVVLYSMIVRNSIQDSLEALVAAKNFDNTLNFLPNFNVDAEDYEENNVALFFTYDDELDIIDFLNGVAIYD